MANERIFIKIIKQDLNWHYLFVLISAIYNNWSDYDKELEKKLNDLLNFLDNKIDLPKNSRDI